MALLEAKQNAERVVELQGRLFSVEAKLEAIDQKLDLRAMTEALEKAVLCIYTKKKIRNLAELLKSKHGLDQEDIMFLTELVPLFDSLKADGSFVDRLKSPADEYEPLMIVLPLMISPESGSSPLYTAVYPSDTAVYPRNVYFQPKDLYHSSHDHRNPKISHMLLDLLLVSDLLTKHNRYQYRYFI